MPDTAFTFICGDDDYLVGHEAKALFNKKAEGIDNDFSREIIEGAAGNIAEVEACLRQFRAAVQTLSLFGDRKVVWLKDVSFLADSVTGRSEGAKEHVAALQELLREVDPQSVDILVSACPVDRRRKEFKWFKEHGRFQDLKGQDSEKSLAEYLKAECAALDVTISGPAAMALIGRVSGNTRLLLEEARKLATYAGAQAEISEKMVMELVPSFGEGDFFEVAEAFFAQDLAWALRAIRRHFFIHSDARGIITTLQNRNRLMIQLRVLIDAGELSGFSKTAFESVQRIHQHHFGGVEDKSSFNLFTQNLWYLGNKIAPAMEGLNLKRLIDYQMAFESAFIGILEHPNEQESVMRDLAIRCLA